ncbi:hypothetical protein EPH_0041450 [Eimeria praecox]|uniref:Uncharacterized protein n=1 Tax=Eimeria praecox TaxID=51316 RepID=U6G5N7_9EIME|nr:hypothetical protein EPH_0041450 [Eimeria praecox]
MIDSSPEGQRQRQAPFCQGLSPEQTAPTSDAAGQVPSGEGRPGAVGQSPSSVPVRRTGGASPASAEANIAATSSAALAAPAARGDPIAATAAAGASAAGEARAASTSVAAADDPPAEAAAAGAANDPLRGAAKAGAAGEASATAASTPRAGEPSPGGALTTTGVANAEAYWIRTHPYVSLPVLQEGVVPPQIHLSASNFVTSNGSSVEGTLLCIRRLFMKQALDQIDASLLVGFLQELAIASAARARGAHRMLRAMHGVATIGLQFLVLDYTVSALHVLGISPPSCSWWEAFTECFDTGYRYMGPRRRTPYGRRVNIDLANRMLAAMSTYKAGTRPDLEEIVDLKRILFFSFCSPSDFRSHTWDPWRTDHLLFEREYPVFSGLLRLRRHIPH